MIVAAGVKHDPPCAGGSAQIRYDTEAAVFSGPGPSAEAAGQSQNAGGYCIMLV